MKICRLPTKRKGVRHGNVIYNKNFKCCKCGKVIAEFNNKNRQRTIRSFVTICWQCYKRTKYYRKSKKRRLE